MFESFLGVNPWTALFILLNTLTIYFVARKYLFAPIMQIITERQQEINDLYTEAGSAKDEAEALRAEYQIKLSHAHAASDRIMRKALALGQAREEEIIRKANADAAAILNKASADIAQEKKKALNDAKNEISEMALTIAGKVVGRGLTHADQQRLVDSFIEELDGSL